MLKFMDLLKVNFTEFPKRETVVYLGITMQCKD